jgi:hypothetical protein
MVSVSCDGRNRMLENCFCKARSWACPIPPPCVPPPVCPPPQDVLMGGGCSWVGQDCPGNPTYCDGAIFYDALRCENDPFTSVPVWTSVAVTVCNSADGGVGPDAFGGDDGGRPDAGWPFGAQ